MFKYKMIALFLFTAVLVSGKAYCQQDMNDPQVRLVSGSVTNVDVESGVLNVKIGQDMMVFYLSNESILNMSAHHMSVIEISQGDPVTIKYVYSSGKNNVINLVDNKPL